MNSPLNSFPDRLLCELDTALRVIAAPARASRPTPASGIAEPVLTDVQRREAAALMRVNHAGEIAAQALYRGQAAVCGDARLKQALLASAAEEHDHLAWCEERIESLSDRTSRLAPAWYAGAFAIGALAGLAGDQISLGFLAETERQVEAHLESHLRRLPTDDTVSRAIVARMRDDEATHRRSAEDRGAAELPAPVRSAMRVASRFMTILAHRL